MGMRREDRRALGGRRPDRRGLRSMDRGLGFYYIGTELMAQLGQKNQPTKNQLGTPSPPFESFFPDGGLESRTLEPAAKDRCVRLPRSRTFPSAAPEQGRKEHDIHGARSFLERAQCHERPCVMKGHDLVHDIYL